MGLARAGRGRRVVLGDHLAMREEAVSFFREVEGEAAIVVHNGVYRQVPVYTRDGYLYAKVGSGFVRLNADGSTTKHQVRLDFLSWTGPLHKDNLGRLCLPEVPKSKRLPEHLTPRYLRAPAGIANG